jgi:uncharacterized membrane protein
VKVQAWDDKRTPRIYKVRIRLGSVLSTACPVVATWNTPSMAAFRSAALIYLFALLIGNVAGLRSMTAPAAVSWAVWAGAIDLGDIWLAFLGYAATPWILTALAVGELAADKHPSIPSRTLLMPFATRIVTGAVSGAAFGVVAGSLPVGTVLGAFGAVIGTLGGSWVRGKLATAFKKDWPAAILEDVVAVGGAVLLVLLVR